MAADYPQAEEKMLGDDDGGDGGNLEKHCHYRRMKMLDRGDARSKHLAAHRQLMIC